MENRNWYEFQKTLNNTYTLSGRDLKAFPSDFEEFEEWILAIGETTEDKKKIKNAFTSFFRRVKPEKLGLKDSLRDVIVNNNILDFQEFYEIWGDVHGKRKGTELIKEEIRKKIEKLDKEASQEEIKEIFNFIPQSNLILKENSINQIKEKTGHSKKILRKIYEKVKSRGYEEKTEKPETLNEFDIGVKEASELAIEEGFDIGDPFEIILYEPHKYILLTSKGVYKMYYEEFANVKSNGEIEINEKVDFEKILFGEFNVLHVAEDKKVDKMRYTFYNGDRKYDTLTKDQALMFLGSDIYKSSRGKDIMTEVFRNLGEKHKQQGIQYNLEYTLGFNNGWKLPQKEEKDGFLILQPSDLDRIVYRRTKKIIKEYSEEEKEEIREKMIRFLQTTDVNIYKHAILIGWVLASPFRLTLIDYFKLFPHIYLVGKRDTGKSSLEDFWIVDFYKAYEKYLPTAILEDTSASKLEDHLSDSTFPINIQEVKKNRNLSNKISIIKSHATGSSDFEKKKDSLRLQVKKPKVAPLSFDSNHLLEDLKDSATNSKMIILYFIKKPMAHKDWKRLRRFLEKEYLFSFVYEFTKNWDNEYLFNFLDDFTERLEEELYINDIFVEDYEKKNPRIMSAYYEVQFGLHIFENSFDIDLEDVWKDKNDGKGFKKWKVLEELGKGRKTMTTEFLQKFITFCRNVLLYGTTSRKNPDYINHELELGTYNDKEYYIFTQDHKRDFMKFLRTRENYALSTELPELLRDGLSNEFKDCIKYERQRYFGEGVIGAIRIKKTWLERYLTDIEIKRVKDRKELAKERDENLRNQINEGIDNIN